MSEYLHTPAHEHTSARERTHTYTHSTSLSIPHCKSRELSVTRQKGEQILFIKPLFTRLSIVKGWDT